MDNTLNSYLCLSCGERFADLEAFTIHANEVHGAVVDKWLKGLAAHQGEEEK
jgi:hypothetical protein